jgi:hypothetical protein
MTIFGTLKPSGYILAIIAFTFVIMAGMGMIGELRQADPTFMSGGSLDEFNTTFNRYDELTSSVGQLQSSLTDSQQDWSLLGTFNALIGTAWHGLVLIISSFNFMNLVFAGLGMFGVPAWVGGLCSLAVVVVLVMAIWAAIFRTEV